MRSNCLVNAFKFLCQCKEIKPRNPRKRLMGVTFGGQTTENYQQGALTQSKCVGFI